MIQINLLCSQAKITRFLVTGLEALGQHFLWSLFAEVSRIPFYSPDACTMSGSISDRDHCPTSGKLRGLEGSFPPRIRAINSLQKNTPNSAINTSIRFIARCAFTTRSADPLMLVFSTIWWIAIPNSYALRDTLSPSKRRKTCRHWYRLLGQSRLGYSSHATRWPRAGALHTCNTHVHSSMLIFWSYISGPGRVYDNSGDKLGCYGYR